MPIPKMEPIILTKEILEAEKAAALKKGFIYCFPYCPAIPIIPPRKKK